LLPSDVALATLERGTIRCNMSVLQYVQTNINLALIAENDLQLIR